jgi:hypothetical protein
MAKTDWKAEAKALKKRVRKLKDSLGAAAAPMAEAVSDAVGDVVAAAKKALKPVSPLAPAAFPALPAIRGAEFAAVEAGVRYQNRKDVMLVRLAPGTTMAGVFTRSSTRSGCVRDCQAKLAMKVPAGAGAAMAAVCLAANRWFFMDPAHLPFWLRAGGLIATVGVAAIVYFGMTRLLKVAEAKEALAMITRRLR